MEKCQFWAKTTKEPAMSVNNLDRFLATIASGKLAIGACITFADPAVTELCADAGMDFLWIDGEHGEIDRNSAMLHFMAIRGTNCASLYRVPSCCHTEIKRIIDFAPAGIIIPMILTEEDARLAVEACRYPLTGTRGVGPRRQIRYGAMPIDEKYWEHARREPLVILQIEHVKAVKNLDKILQVPGVDSCLIGPYDLTCSMGKPGQFRDPEVIEVIDTICRKCRAAGKILGAYAESDYDLWAKRGIQFISAANDTGILFKGLQQMRAKVESQMEQA